MNNNTLSDFEKYKNNTIQKIKDTEFAIFQNDINQKIQNLEIKYISLQQKYDELYDKYTLNDITQKIQNLQIKNDDLYNKYKDIKQDIYHLTTT